MSGWFPGKIISGHLRHSHEDGSHKASSEDSSENFHEMTAKEERELEKTDRGLQKLLLMTRQKYLDNGLEGSIEFYSCFGVFTTTISCAVSADSQSAEEPDDNAGAAEFTKSSRSSSNSEAVEELSALQRMMIPAIDLTLSKLLFRARFWSSSRISDNVTIGDGVYVTIPFLGLASVSVSLTATVKSLAAYNERKKHEMISKTTSSDSKP